MFPYWSSTVETGRTSGWLRTDRIDLGRRERLVHQIDLIAEKPSLILVHGAVVSRSQESVQRGSRGDPGNAAHSIAWGYKTARWSRGRVSTGTRNRWEVDVG